MGRKLRLSGQLVEQDLFDAGDVPIRARLGVVDRQGEAPHPEKTRAELIVGLTLPPPPSANIYYRSSVIKLKRPSFKQMRFTGGYKALTYVSKEGKAYKETVAQRILEKGLNYHSKAPIALLMVVCMGTNGRADIDNRLKPVCDALKDAGVFEDDCQIVKIDIERGPVVKGGRVIVSVTEVIPDPHGAVRRSGWSGKT